MDKEKIEESLGEEIERTGIRKNKYGEYHPSTISGCPLKSVFKWMTDHETKLNRWLFQGSAVHYYLQQSGILDEALHNAGYHKLYTEYEVSTRHEIESGITIVGSCDILADGRNHTRTIFDIKYSSIPPHSGHSRLYKYMSQVNTYAHMFDADEYALIMINSKSDNIPEDIAVLEGEPSEDNWDIVKSKARMIHKVLTDYGYPGGDRWSVDMLESADEEFWKGLMNIVDKQQCPSHEKECDYCDFKGFCPVYNGTLGGIRSLRGGK